MEVSGEIQVRPPYAPAPVSLAVPQSRSGPFAENTCHQPNAGYLVIQPVA
jgi:hypothetical protein